ncbi:hypothetical protein [Pseudopontixanthobacter vadosimaris]|uniref:hypothetical protein n=1 Tax=Pseudopontixanthobacter vadosimaris TaxID=2726450 RepID=UPI0014765A0D|nr:hypothetical protein [Pseudopontixanthobacter vadosimaris]
MTEGTPPWEHVTDPSYFKKVMHNMVDLGFGPRRSEIAHVRFGLTGIGHAPNYQIEGSDGVKHCFRGMGHSKADDVEDEFAPDNLSSQQFSYKEVERFLSKLLDDRSPSPPQVTNNPFSLEEFRTTSLGQKASSLIYEQSKEIVHVADAGEPPLSVIVPQLQKLTASEPWVIERMQWDFIDRMIREWLGSAYEEIGRGRVSDKGPRGRYYKRTPSAR